MRSRLTRKQFLVGVGTVLVAGARRGWSVGSVFGRQDTKETSERLARVIREYDAQGIHRTGTEVDTASARWLAEEVRSAGLEPVLEGVAFERTDVRQSFVEIAGERVEGVPLFDGTFTADEGVAGRLGTFASESSIGFGKVPPRGPSVAEFRAHRESTSQSAVIAVTGGAWFDLPPGLALLNARYRSPFGPPGIQLGSEAWPWLEAAAASDATAKVVVAVERKPVEVYNVIATLNGRDPSLAPLVVMTPRSGWWQCASERGGGIAVWLEMMRRLGESARDRDVHFVASTGHELGHYGLEAYLEKRKSLIQGAHAWIHLGANLGAAVKPGFMIQTSESALEELALGALKGFDLTPNRIVPGDTRAGGEAMHIYNGGGRYISAIGDNGLFHHPADRWPDSVDIDVVTDFALAFCEMGARLTRAS